MRSICASNLFAMAVFVDNRRGLEVDLRDLRIGETLAVAIFENDHYGIAVVSGRSNSVSQSRQRCEQQNCGNCQ